MRQQTIAVLCLVSGIGAGYALSPVTWQAVNALTSKQSELPDVSAGAALIDVMTLVSVKKGVSEATVRRGIAKALDRLLVASGYEVRVVASSTAGRPTITDDVFNRVLLVNGNFGRAETMKLARQFDFGSLQRAGFEIFATGRGHEQRGYIVDNVVAEGSLMAPLDGKTLGAARDTIVEADWIERVKPAFVTRDETFACTSQEYFKGQTLDGKDMYWRGCERLGPGVPIAVLDGSSESWAKIQVFHEGKVKELGTDPSLLKRRYESDTDQ